MPKGRVVRAERTGEGTDRQTDGRTGEATGGEGWAGKAHFGVGVGASNSISKCSPSARVASFELSGGGVGWSGRRFGLVLGFCRDAIQR